MFMIFVITALLQANCRAMEITVTSGRSTADDQQSGQCLVTQHYLPSQNGPEATDNDNRPTKAPLDHKTMNSAPSTSDDKSRTDVTDFQVTINSGSHTSDDKGSTDIAKEYHMTMNSASSTSDDKSRSDVTAATINTAVIGFNVRLSETKTYSSTDNNIVWDQVVDNSGHSYNLTTGRVTAPLTGRYYFAVTTVSPTRDRANVDIMVNGSMLCRVMSAKPNDVGSCQGIRHMSAGDQAWVQAYNGTNTFKANASSFTGFLLAGAGDVSRESFTVRMTSNKLYSDAGDKLTWDQALDNYGRSMNLTTGTFTAPVQGQYFFALTTASPVADKRACARIWADGVVICGVCACSRGDCRDMASCQATASLTAGHTVWVETYFSSQQQFRAEVTTFSGFLVSVKGDQEPPVSFTATMTTRIKHSTDGQRVMWNTTTDNTGEGYDNSTGHFTAPVVGHYLLAVTTRSWSSNRRGDVDVVTSEGQTVCRVDSDTSFDSGSCQGVVRLDSRQRVWVETLHCPCTLTPDGLSVFTGFLIQQAKV